MIDNDIIKTLESIASESIGDCSRDCAFYDGRVHYCAGVVAKNSLTVINHQKAEIERLNKIRAKLSKEIDTLKLEMSYMLKPNAIGDNHEMGSW